MKRMQNLYLFSVQDYIGWMYKAEETCVAKKKTLLIPICRVDKVQQSTLNVIKALKL